MKGIQIRLKMVEMLEAQKSGQPLVQQLASAMNSRRRKRVAAHDSGINACFRDRNGQSRCFMSHAHPQTSARSALGVGRCTTRRRRQGLSGCGFRQGHGFRGISIGRPRLEMERNTESSPSREAAEGIRRCTGHDALPAALKGSVSGRQLLRGSGVDRRRPHAIRNPSTVSGPM